MSLSSKDCKHVNRSKYTTSSQQFQRASLLKYCRHLYLLIIYFACTLWALRSSALLQKENKKVKIFNSLITVPSKWIWVKFSEDKIDGKLGLPNCKIICYTWTRLHEWSSTPDLSLTHPMEHWEHLIEMLSLSPTAPQPPITKTSKEVISKNWSKSHV